MTEFLKWVFCDDTPVWVTATALVTGLFLGIAWNVLVLAAISSGSELLILCAAAPPAILWWHIWKKYQKERKND